MVAHAFNPVPGSHSLVHLCEYKTSLAYKEVPAQPETQWEYILTKQNNNSSKPKLKQQQRNKKAKCSQSKAIGKKSIGHIHSDRTLVITWEAFKPTPLITCLSHGGVLSFLLPSSLPPSFLPFPGGSGIGLGASYILGMHSTTDLHLQTIFQLLFWDSVSLNYSVGPWACMSHSLEELKLWTTDLSGALSLVYFHIHVYSTANGSLSIHWTNASLLFLCPLTTGAFSLPQKNGDNSRSFPNVGQAINTFFMTS